MFLKEKKMCVSVELRNWIVLYPIQMDSQIRKFVGMIQQVGRPQGFNVPEPR